MVPDSAATATAIFAGAKTEELYQTLCAVVVCSIRSCCLIYKRPTMAMKYCIGKGKILCYL